MPIDVALSGDSILNRRVSVIEDDGFREAVGPLRAADVGLTHLETNILEYDDPEAFPAAEAGGTWMRSPPAVADELDWLGIDLVSHASNHAGDYAYGGLRSTWRELDRVGIPYAGTGRTLGDARAPAYLDAPGGRVGLVSMASSITRWTRAGEPRGDVPGRPGANPLRYHHVVDEETLEAVLDVAEAFGWWIEALGEGRWQFNPPGLHNTLVEVVEGEENGTIPHEGDLDGNARAVADAAERSDVAIAHVHAHEFGPSGDVGTSAAFLETAARRFVEAGADVVLVQGSHSPLRPIEVCEGTPIFYDPGDLFRMSDTVERMPAEFYERYAGALDVHPADATPAEGFRARLGGEDPGTETGFTGVRNPPGGYDSGSVFGFVIPVCTFEDGELERIELHPGRLKDDPSPGEIGIPEVADEAHAEAILSDLAAKSAPYGTTIRVEDGVGVVEV